MSAPNPRPSPDALAHVIAELARAYDRLGHVTEASPDAVRAADAVIEARTSLWRHLIADGWVAPKHVTDQLGRDTALATEPVPPHAEQAPGTTTADNVRI